MISAEHSVHSIVLIYDHPIYSTILVGDYLEMYLYGLSEFLNFLVL